MAAIVDDPFERQETADQRNYREALNERDRLRAELATKDARIAELERDNIDLDAEKDRVFSENGGLCMDLNRAKDELAASRKWNQDLLDAARDDRRAAEWRLAVFAASKKLETEFEAYKASYEYNDVDLDGIMAQTPQAARRATKLRIGGES